MLRRYVRPSLGERLLMALRPLDLQTTYQQMMQRGLSARTVRYTHAVLRTAMRQAVSWRLLLECPADGVKLPLQPRPEMQALRWSKFGYFSRPRWPLRMAQHLRWR